MRAVSSLAAFSTPELERVLEWVDQPPAAAAPLVGRVVAVLPFGPTEPSAAAWIAAAGRLGATVVRADDLAADPADGLSAVAEAARWADLLVVSHPDSGFARAAALHTGAPVVAAGETRGEDVAGGVSLLAEMRSKVQRPEDLRVAVCGDLEGSPGARALLGGLAALGAAIVLVPAQGCDLPEDDLARLARRLGGRPARFAAESMRSLLDMVDTIVLSPEETPQLPLFEEVDVPPGESVLRVRTRLEEIDFMFVATRGEASGRLIHAPFRSGRSLRMRDGAPHRTRRGAVEAVLRFAGAMDTAGEWRGDAVLALERYTAPEGLHCGGRLCVQRRDPERVPPDFAVLSRSPWMLECLYCGVRTTAEWTGSRQERRFHPVEHGVARAILPENRVLFRDAVEAHAAGFEAARRRQPGDEEV